MIARQATDEQFRQAINQADFRVADGNGLLIAAKILGRAIQHRIPGIELVESLLLEGQKRGWSFYFLGGKTEVVSLLTEVLQDQYPQIAISGFHHGYFHDSFPIIEDINQASPDILFVGLGSPQQELWIQKNRSRLHATVMVGVGGSFDVLCGRKKRAPLFFRQLKLEWLYRIVSEPNRFKRVIPAFVRFGWMVMKERLKIKST